MIVKRGDDVPGMMLIFGRMMIFCVLICLLLLLLFR